MESQSPCLTTVSITAEVQSTVIWGEKKSGFVNMEHYEIGFLRSTETGEASKTRRMALFCPFLNCLKSTHYKLIGEFS